MEIVSCRRQNRVPLEEGFAGQNLAMTSVDL